MPLVSVVIPAYNYGRYLGHAIDSVLGQTCLDFEIIVVDDGSTDNTAQIVAAYSDPRIRYVFQNNAGLSAARNTGIREARSSFIALLDADDMWMPTLLSTVMARFSELPADVAMIACASIRVDATGTPIGGKAFEPTCDRYLTAADIILQSRFMPSTVVARREVFSQCGDFDTNLSSSEDRDMWIRIGTRFKLYRVGTPLVFIRKHPNNMSKHADRMRVNMIRVIRKAYSARVVSPGNFAFWLRVLSIYYFQNAWMQFDERRGWNAVRDGGLSLLLWPYFPDHRDLNEPYLFRIRAFVRFLASCVLSRNTPKAGKLE